MEKAIALFAELGRRLGTFGRDKPSRRIIRRAEQENGWFTEPEIRRAVEALRSEMLDQVRLRAWLAPYRVPVAVPRDVLVIMAGNLPLVGFFDLLCVVASGHRCLVKPSSKDRVLIGYAIDELKRIDPATRVGYYDDALTPDAVIATGGDNANRYFRAHYAGIPSLLRGSRHSVAALSGRETPEQLAGLADDIWAYSGLGCRSVSLIFAPEGYEPALQIPPVNDKYINNYRQQRALLEMQGRPFVDLGCAVAVEQCAFPAALSRIAYAHYATLDEVVAWLAGHDGELQCVVTGCLPHSRRAGFGCAQSPALTDYPDDRDVLAWLAALD